VRAVIRPVTFALLVILSCVSARSQGNSSAKEDNLYSMALFASVAQMDKSWGHIDDSYLGGLRTDYHHTRVRKDLRITDGLPSEVDGYKVEYLDDRALADRYKALKKGFSVLEISPIQNHGAELKINITVSYLEFRKGKMLFAVSDWSNVTFDYDPEGQKFVISKVELGGI